MVGCKPELVAWVGSNIIPHEAAVRRWLRQCTSDDEEISDLVQDAYAAILRLKDVSHVRNPRNYFFQAARSALLMKLRRDRIVPIERLAAIEDLALADDAPGPDRHVNARLELQKILEISARLPERCRQVFELRRLEGLSQKEVAMRLGLPEHTVEQQSIRALRLVLEGLEVDGRFDEAKGDRRILEDVHVKRK